MNKIIIAQDQKYALDLIQNELANSPISIYEKDEFSIDDTRDLIAEAYIASEKEKYIILLANSYNKYAQNAMLKILEETPKNINIFLIAKRKSIFLPTVRSRLSVRYINSKKVQKDIIFDFDKLDLKSIYNYIKSFQYQNKEDAKFFIELALNHYVKNVDRFPSKEILDLMQRSYALVDLNTPSHIAILPLILALLKEKNGSKTSRQY